MFTQLTIFVFSIFISIVLSILTIPKLIFKAEWSIISNSYLLNPNNNDLIGHYEYIDMKGGKVTDTQKEILNYFGHFINTFKLESFRLITNDKDLLACTHGPLSISNLYIDYVTDESIKSKYLQLKINLSSSTKSDLEICIEKLNHLYLFVLKDIFRSSNFPYDHTLSQYNKNLNNIENIENKIILNLNKITSEGLSGENYDVLLKILQEINIIQNNKNNLEKQINFLKFSKNYTNNINFISIDPKYSTSLDNNKIGRFLLIFFITFFLFNFLIFLNKIYNLKTLLQKLIKNFIN